MVMAANERADDRNAAPPPPSSPPVATSVRSVWNIPPPLPAVVDRETATSPVMAMGPDSWPALGQAPARTEARTPPPPPPAQPAPPPAPAPAPARQGHVANHRHQGPGNSNASHRHPPARRHKKSEKRNSNSNPNGAPAFRAPILRPPPMHMGVYDYGPGYQPFPPLYANGRPPFYPLDNSTRRLSFSNRPPFFGHGPGFVAGTGPIPRRPYPPGPLPVRGPHPPRYQSGVPVQPTEMALRDGIVRQIDYYFCDENLPNDHYLRSLMDAQGWVPISIVANFPRVRRMCGDLNFIINSLKSSSAIEVQGDKIRKRNNWRKWIPSSSNDGVVEELEKEIQNVSISGSAGRIHDEDDEMIVNEHDVERLVIVTEGIPPLSQV